MKQQTGAASSGPQFHSSNRALDQANLEKLNEAYSSEPWWYDIRGFLILTFAYRSTLPSQIRLFSKNIGERHLEAAIGTGSLFEIILKWRKFKRQPISHVLGFDYADRMLKGAQNRFKNEKSIQLLRADIGDLPLDSSTYDTANIANAVHCLPDVKKGFQELHRVLKTEGTLAGNVLLYPKGQSLLDRLANRINHWGTRKGILNRPYQKEEVRELLLQTGFELVFEEVNGNCFDFVARKR